MARTCTVCRHDDRHGIEEALVRGEPLRRLAVRFHVSKSALTRHRRDHLPAHLTRAAEADAVTAASSLLDQMQDLQRRTLEILDAPESQRTALAAVGQARGNVQLLAELTGKLAHQPTVNVLLSSAAWLEIRRTLADALVPFPEARAAVALALNTLAERNGRPHA